MKRERIITLKHLILRGRLFLRIIVFELNNMIPSLGNGMKIDFSKLRASQVEKMEWAQSEKELIENIIRYLTNDLTKKWSSLKGISDKIRPFTIGLKEYLVHYAKIMIKKPLESGILTKREKKIVEDLELIIPLSDFIKEDEAKEESKPKPRTKFLIQFNEEPEIYFRVIYGFLSASGVTKKDDVLHDVKDSAKYIVDLLPYVKEFNKSKYSSNPIDDCGYNWFHGTLKDRFLKFLEFKFRDETEYANVKTVTGWAGIKNPEQYKAKTVEIIEKIALGILHSKGPLEMVMKSRGINN